MKICLGAGNFGTSTSKRDAFAVMDRYLEMGGTMIDTANVYARWGPEKENLSEQYIGEWLKSRHAADKITVATKGGHYDLDTPQIGRIRKDCIRHDLEESMRALGLEQIALYWVHKDDRSVPVEEIVDMMEELVREGLIGRYGFSNMRLDRVERARVYAKENGRSGFCALQDRASLASINPDNPAWRDPGTVILDEAFAAWHEEHQIPLYAYSSTAQGFFEKQRTGRLSDSMKAAYGNERNRRIGELMEEASAQSGLSCSALSLLGLAARPFPVLPIAAVSRTEQLDEFAPLMSEAGCRALAEGEPCRRFLEGVARIDAEQKAVSAIEA